MDWGMMISGVTPDIGILANQHNARVSRCGNDELVAVKKPVVMLTMQGDVIREFNSVSEASDHVGVSVNAISRVCRSIDQAAKGYRFMFLSDYHGQTLEPYHDNRGTKGICQYTKEGRLVDRYKSIREAAEKTGLMRSTIVRSCRKGGSRILHHDYTYRYESDVNAISKTIQAGDREKSVA